VFVPGVFRSNGAIQEFKRAMLTVKTGIKVVVRSFGGMVLALATVVLLAGCGSSGDPKETIARAEGHRAKGNFKAAIIEFKNVLQKDAAHAEARYLLGLTYHDSRDYRSAEQELRRALEFGYDRNKVMPVLGKSMLALGQFQKVLDEVPESGGASAAVQADLLTLRARALSGLGQAEKARALIDQALALQPDFTDALLAAARHAAGARKLDEASGFVDRALRGAPRNVDAWLLKGELARLRADKVGLLAANEKVIEVDPNNVVARLNMASLYVADDKIEEARKLVTQSKALAPGNVMVVYMQALIEFKVRDFKAAKDSVQQVLKVAPEHLPSILLAGAIEAELGSYGQAQTHLSAVLERAPGNLYARRLMVTTLARSGQTQRAQEVLQAGLKQAPEDAQLLSLAGELYVQGGEFGKAAEYFERAAKRNPQDAMARSRLGLSRLASGETERAFADLESAVAIDATAYQPDMVLVMTHLRRGNYDQALKAMASLEKKQPNNPATYNLKAIIYLGKIDIPNARKQLERALELQPAFLVAARNLAQIDLQEKNPKAARGRLEAVLGKDPGSVPALLALAELGPALGATQSEQVDWLERARKANPQSVQPPLMLARLYSQAGDTKKALELAQQVQAANAENPQFLDLLGNAQLGAGQKDQALITFHKLVKLQPNSPVALYRLAGVQAAAAQHEAAEETLQKSLALKPDFTDALVALVPLQLRAKRYVQAMTTARQIQKQNPKAPVGYALEGDVLMAENKFPQAVKAYEAVQGTAGNSSLRVRLHKAYLAAGMAQEGNARLAQWLKEAPDDRLIRLHAAESALGRADYKDAITHYEWLLQKQADNVMLLNNLAWAYFQNKDARALPTAERAHKLAPEDPSVADTLAIQLIAGGDHKRGIELLEKATKAAPEVAEMRYHLAQGWIKAGDKPKARAELERVLSSGQKFSGYEDAQKLLKQLRE
jgi:putative PEP-CTERM system TPR-repeat lipoprotein